MSNRVSKKSVPIGRTLRWGLLLAFVATILATALWLRVSIVEWRYGRRMIPWSAYAFCGKSVPETWPDHVRVGLYEEFPAPWRLDKLEQVDFPVTLAIAAPSRAAFLDLREEIQATYPQVREVYFWPVLSQDEGYYTGGWSDPEGIRRAAEEAKGLPILWDLELPLDQSELAMENWWANRSFLGPWLRGREADVHIWRSHTSMGLDPAFLRLAAMHYDPLDYPVVTLHLDLYMQGAGAPEDEVYRIMRCGVERYGDRFVPSLGVLNDGEGPEEIFVPVETLRRNLELARKAGVSEVWLFGVNGLNADYLSALRDVMPLEPLSDRSKE